MLVSFGISIIQNLKPFGYVSTASTFIIFGAFLAITVYNIVYVVQTDDDLTEKLTYFNIGNFFAFCGLAFYT